MQVPTPYIKRHILYVCTIEFTVLPSLLFCVCLIVTEKKHIEPEMLEAAEPPESTIVCEDSQTGM